LIFDFDGTLFDTRLDIAAAVNHARREFGCPTLTLSEITGMVGDGIGVLAARAFKGTDVDLVHARDVMMDYYSKHPADTATPYPGVMELLPSLGGTLTVVSNKPRALVDKILQKQGLLDPFSFVGGGDTFERMKPDPMAVDFLIERFGASREQTVVVGDHRPDIEMARNAGTKSVFCTYGFSGRDTVGADLSIERFEDLPGALLRLKADPKPAS